MNTTTNFMGLKIKSPIIVGSCGLTSDLETLKKIEKAGAGAVILKSVFEEQIMQEMANNLNITSDYEYSPETYDYVVSHTQEQSIDKYVNLIKAAKQELSIPIIASVNCISASQWISFASKMEQAGADGVELNMFILPSDVNTTTDDVERIYEDVIQSIRRAISIPVSLKISPYFSSLARFAQKVSWMGIANLHIFNRFATQDIDINKICLESANVFSSPSDIHRVLRWTAILSNIINCPLTAGGGVHKPQDVIKLLLAGGLQRALINYFLDINTEAGYLEVEPPVMVNEASGFGTGQLPDKEGQMYHAIISCHHLYIFSGNQFCTRNLNLFHLCRKKLHIFL